MFKVAMFDDIFETVNSGFAQALYEDYLRDPKSVPEEWRKLFENGIKGEEPVKAATDGRERPEAKDGSGSKGQDEAEGDSKAPGEAIAGPALRLLKNMEASLTVPTATSFRDIDVSLLWDIRAALNRALKEKKIKLSFTHLIGWAIVKAAREMPVMLHAVLDGKDGPRRFDPGAVNFGLAVDVERKDGSRGLMVPVLKKADTLSFAEFHEEYERLVAGARDGKLLPDAYTGGTITLTNPGTIGTVASVPRLMKGQGSIIATGAIREIAGQRLMTMTSTYDHRIIQGAESGIFLQRVDALLNGEDGFYDDVAKEMGVELKPVEIAEPAAPAAAGVPSDPEFLFHFHAATSLVRAHRTVGYLAATLDPLGARPIGDPALDPGPLGLTDEILRQIPTKPLRVAVKGGTLADALPQLRDTYCGTIAYEFEHIGSHEQRVWLRRTVEAGEHRKPLSKDESLDLLDQLTRVDGFERFLHRAYLGQKRFGIEGLDMLVPMLRLAVELSAEQGAQEIVMGMAHRGRLNVLTHIVGRSYGTLLAEFEGGRKVEETLAPKGGTGDVKYHHGASGDVETKQGNKVTVRLLPNPSHLEAVNPVVEGWTRARQTDRSSVEAKVHPERVVPILMHGDAAFAAQGVVAETFNLSRLPGYSTGGTLHIITNNQVGFTTNPREGRSTDFASDLAKGFDVPIVHVNADDPEACLAAVKLAMMYRARFPGDVVINLIGYRRHGHNEGDEPRYTQPLMYEMIDDHPPVREQYAKRLVEAGMVSSEEAAQKAESFQQQLTKTRERVQEDAKEANGEEPVRITEESHPEPDTRVAADTLLRINEELLKVPDGFTVNKKLARALEKRREIADDGSLDWAHAEALAFGSLLAEGVPVRLTGQDTERATFSQRHAVLHDAETGKTYVPLRGISDARASFEIHNSPLSEYACLGFEYGYAVAEPGALVLWEAQFGDFVNGAEIIIDQFLVAGMSKWGQTSRLGLLLPHGYEGQGPEHSSARIERFLALGAERNLRVANCSTPAQYFHIIRRQALHSEIRPLVLMTPKSLLRHSDAVSSLEELAEGSFRPVLDDTTLNGSRSSVKRLVLCSGKVYYDLIGSDLRKDAQTVAVARIELLYPFPFDEIRDLLGHYDALDEVVWVQEEPSNMGARKWVVPQLRELAPDTVKLRWVARPERSSPAEGYPAQHKAEQDRIVREALT